MTIRPRPASTAPRRRMATEWRLFLTMFSCAIPMAVLIAICWSGRAVSATIAAALAAFSAIWLVVVANAIRRGMLHHIRTLSNLVESTRIQDYSMKGAWAREHGELGELYKQINSLIDSLKISRQSERELLSVLEKVVSQINVAIIVFDSRDRIRLVNDAASALLKSSPDKLVGLECAATELAKLPNSAEAKLVDFRFAGAEGRWQIREHYYRHQGEASRILFIADLKQVLSDEEIAAWQRLIRVIGHEVNNSLTPITSLCQTLNALLARPEGGHEEDLREGLSVIAERAKGLQDFISVYARIARLPEPHKILFPVAELARKLRRIFSDQILTIGTFPAVRVFGDPVHLEQALLNLIKNGIEANPAGAPPVELSCELREGWCDFRVTDHGAGIVNPGNLFVPFYTTKPQGAGIGLVLCRQIAAKHHGEVMLNNHPEGAGAVARISLPLPPQR